jgi:3-phenylpropionate/cinnamic acid dioxygenase small subunit
MTTGVGKPSAGVRAASRSIEERLQALEDEREIRELLIFYAQRLDGRDHAGYAALFAREGRWSGKMGDYTGPAAIEKMLVDAFGPTPAGFQNTNNFHLMSNMIIRVDGDRASAQSRITYFERNDLRPEAKLAGRYDDELVREDGRWLFLHRHVVGEIPTAEEMQARDAQKGQDK